MAKRNAAYSSNVKVIKLTKLFDSRAVKCLGKQCFNYPRLLHTNGENEKNIYSKINGHHDGCCVLFKPAD